MEAVDQSTVTGGNIFKLCGLHDGTVVVPVHDWVKFLEPFFMKILGISKFHHFQFTKEHPGVFFCRILTGSEEIEFHILIKTAVRPQNHLPLPVVPLGLHEDRK